MFCTGENGLLLFLSINLFSVFHDKLDSVKILIETTVSTKTCVEKSEGTAKVKKKQCYYDRSLIMSNRFFSPRLMIKKQFYTSH